MPDFDEEKFTKRQNLGLAALVEVLGGLVEGVGGMVATGLAHEAEKFAVASSWKCFKTFLPPLRHSCSRIIS